MKKLVILGAGTAGTMMANHLRSELDKRDWEIDVIDHRQEHYYQPGFLFLPFDIYKPKDLVKSISSFIPKGVNLVSDKADKIVSAEKKVVMQNGDVIHYDILIIATGCDIAPEEVEGMNGAEWKKSVFDFYTFEGSLALRNKLRTWKGGKLVVHITEMPIKCPVAPLEFAFLADS